MNKLTVSFILSCTTVFVWATEPLSLSEAVKITLENGYNIQVAENNSEISKNNASVYANGFLPQLSGRGGASYRNQNSRRDYYDGSQQDVNGSGALGYNASLALNYTIFDGMYRSYNYEKSQELYNLSKLQVRQEIESTLVQLFSAYYTVASLSGSTQSLKQTLEISKDRLQRVVYGAEYGKNTQLDVLNATVDVNTDSINLLNTRQNLNNSKRNLNVLMGREVNLPVVVDTTVMYEPLPDLNLLLERAKEENIRLLAIDKTRELAGFDIKLLKTNIIPTIGLNGVYSWNHTNFNSKNLMERETIYGPQAEVSLAWNIFDGGRTKVGLRNARIAEETALVQKEQTEKLVERDVINAYTTYTNSLFVLEAEKANLLTSRRNFDRSSEQYQLGQLTSLEFRQAQLNLLHAETRYNQAKYETKIYELSLFKLSGDLLNIQF